MECMKHFDKQELPVAAARRGDSAAWEILFKRYQLPLFTYLMQMLRRREICFDLVQETFLAAIRHLDSLRCEERFGSWMFSIAHQKALQWLRRHRWNQEESWEQHTAERELVSDEAGPVDLLIQDEDEAAFGAALERLSGEQREAILLYWLENFSVAEIAEITAVPPGTVKSRLFHARKNLKRHLERVL